MQTNRAVCSSTRSPANSTSAAATCSSPPHRPIRSTAASYCRKSKRIAPRHRQHPLGPPADPGLVQAAEVYDAILTGKPYPVKAAGLVRQRSAAWATAIRCAAKPHSKRSTSTCTSTRRSIPARRSPTCFCRQQPAGSAKRCCRPSKSPKTRLNWAQLRPAVAKPVGESRSEVGDHLRFGQAFGSDRTFLRRQYRSRPRAINSRRPKFHDRATASQPNRHARFESQRGTENMPRSIPSQGRPKGFNTPTGKIEIYSTTFANSRLSADTAVRIERVEKTPNYPLTLTFFRDIHFCDEQHRNIPRLRRAVPEPFVEIHPSTAKANGIEDGEWIFLETATGKVKLKAKFNDSLHPEVVATVYGWWQACQN